MCPVWTGPNNCTFGLSFTHKNRHFYTLICSCFLQLFTWWQKAKVFASCVSFVTCSMLLFFVAKLQLCNKEQKGLPFLVSFETRPCSFTYLRTNLRHCIFCTCSLKESVEQKKHISVFPPCQNWGHWQNSSAFQMSLCWKSFLRI